MKKAPEMEAPMNANERFLHAVAVRLDVIIEQNNSVIKYLSENGNVPVTNQRVTTRSTEVQPEPSSKEEVKEAPKRKAKPKTKE